MKEHAFIYPEAFKKNFKIGITVPSFDVHERFTERYNLALNYLESLEANINLKDHYGFSAYDIAIQVEVENEFSFLKRSQEKYSRFFGLNSFLRFKWSPVVFFWTL